MYVIYIKLINIFIYTFHMAKKIDQSFIDQIYVII